MNSRTIPIKSDTDALQSELAALREELAGANRSAETLHEVIGRMKSERDAAEQRNVILEAGLRGVVLKCNESWTRAAVEMFAEEVLETALKPTESGASE